jgi:hypothetical protein
MANENFEAFVNALNQLEQDQTLYESELGNDDLTGVKHEEIVKLGGILCKRFQKLAEKGQSFADTLAPDFLPKLTESMFVYQDLIMPPKVFGGFCPCLKPARSGVEYDRKFLTAKSKMVSGVFLTQAVLIEHKGEQHNMESMHYADYANKMNKVFDFLSDIRCNAKNEKMLESARKKLLAAVEHVDKFVQHFGDSSSSSSSGGKIEFKVEALRRIRAAQDLLTSSRPVSAEGVAMPVGPRMLVKAQSSLQEIMNSAAAIASTQARENLHALDALQRLLKKSREIEVNQFNAMEDEMNELNLLDLLSRLREDSELLHSDANSKLRDAVKRWTAIKTQAVPRKVAEYKEDFESSSSSSSTMLMASSLPGNPDLKVFQGAGNKIKTVGRFAEMITKEAVTGVGGVVGEVRSFAQNSAAEVKNNATNAVKKVGSVFAVDDSTSGANNGTNSGSNNGSHNALQRSKSTKVGSGSGSGLGTKNNTSNSNNNNNNSSSGSSILRMPEFKSPLSSDNANSKTVASNRPKSRFPKIDLDAF